MYKKVLIFGGTGGVGKGLEPILLARYYDVKLLGSVDCDLLTGDNIEAVIKDHDPDIIINLAVKNHDGPIHKQNGPKLDEQLDVNVKAATLILSYGLAHLRKKGGGKIILASSILASRPVAGAPIYGASKAYINHLVKTAALENASKGITVNTIELGYLDVGIINVLSPEMLKYVIDTIPMKRLGTVKEVANAINFILDTDYVNGTNLVIAGGL